MLRYIEDAGLVEVGRTASGYRVYGPGELQRLRTLRELLARFDCALSDVAFARRMTSEQAAGAARRLDSSAAGAAGGAPPTTGCGGAGEAPAPAGRRRGATHIPKGEDRRMSIETQTQDYKVADIGLADFGRKEITLAEHEMPGLMAMREEYGARQPLKGARVTGSLHMTVETAVLIETLVALGAEEARSIFSTRTRCRRHRQGRHPGLRLKGGRSRSTGGAPGEALTWPDAEHGGPNMILDDGGDATLLVRKGHQFEKAGAVPTRRRRLPRSSRSSCACSRTRRSVTHGSGLGWRPASST